MSHPWQNHQEVAIRAVRLAARACESVRKTLVTSDALEKKDKSPVTVADFASQAIVCALLGDAFPDIPIVGEEDSADLRGNDRQDIRTAVVDRVAEVWDGTVDENRVLTWIDRGAADPHLTLFWTLDPIDGTKGFLRDDQYAVALGLIENGHVVLGVLGCPNLPNPAPGPPPGNADHASGNLGNSPVGAMFVAVKGHGTTIHPLWESSGGTSEGNPERNSGGTRTRVSTVTDPSLARFCESVESGHSDQSASVQIASRLGITGDPVRMDSQAKYAALARGDASIYLRLPTRADYQEKIWDHAAGSLVVTEAGGTVTDVTGKPLDFTRGRTLEHNRGVIATNGSIHDRVVEVVGEVLGNGSTPGV